MPQVENGYVSLGNGQTATVYNTTTEPTGPQSVFESVKRVIGQAIGNNTQDTNMSLLGNTKAQPTIISATR